MRRLTALFVFIASFVMASAGFAQAEPPKGLFLVTDYPSQTVRAGEIATIRVKLTNAGLPPEPVALSLAGVPTGWKVDILGGGQPVASAMPGVNQDVALQLRVDVPKDAQPGSQKIVLSAKGPLTQAPDLVVHPHRRHRDAGQAQPEVAPAVVARHAALGVRIYGHGRQRQRQGPHRGAVGAKSRPISRPPSPKASAPMRSARSRSRRGRARTSRSR